MERYRVEAIHIDTLGHTTYGPLGIFGLILHELNCSFEVECFDKGRFAQNFTRSLLRKGQSELGVGLVGLRQYLVKKVDGGLELLLLKVGQCYVVVQLSAATETIVFI